MAFDPTAYMAIRPDLVNNWNNASNPGYQPKDEQDAANIQAIKQYPSMGAYLQSNYTPAEDGAIAQWQQQNVAGPAQLPGAQGGIVQPGLGFGGLITPPTGGGGSPPPVVPPTVPPTTPPPTTPPPTTPPPPTGTSVKPTYSQLLVKYQQDHPGEPAPSGDQFNAWVQSSGAAPNGWENDTPNTPNVYAPAGPQNYNQNQTGSQTGGFNTNNTTDQTSHQTTGQVQNTTGSQATTQNQTNAQATTGETQNTQNQTGGQSSVFDTTNTGATTGQSTTGVTDTLGFGGLLKGAAAGAQQSDATRQNFLSDLVNTGGSAMQSQTDQAVRNSLTGPALTGAGDSARARAAGYAGAQVARNNTDQRLNAAQQLTGPTALTQLSSAANPYLGQTQSTSGTSTGGQKGTTNATNFSDLINNTLSSQNTVGAQNTTGTQNTTGNQTTGGFSDLVNHGTEGSTGTATGASAQNASGLIPQAQQVSTGGGGCIICTVGIHHSLWRQPRLLRRVVRHKLQTDAPRFRRAVAGYFLLFTPIAKFLLRHPTAARYAMPLARSVVYEELRISGRRVPLRVIPWLAHWSWHGICSLAGLLPTPRHLTDSTLIALAKENNVFFLLSNV